jgi:hypothetical protein
VNSLRVHSLQQNLEVRAHASRPEPSVAVRARVEELWGVEKQARGAALFDGKLFSIASIEAERIVGWLTSYKYFVAQLREPSLFESLQVRPLGVTGLFVCADGVVCGLRGNHVQQDAGLWEIGPSGGVDDSTVTAEGRIDLAKQILAELQEEIGVSADSIAFPITVLGAVEDLSNHVVDVGLLLRSSITGDEIRHSFARIGNPEYQRVEIVPPSEITRFLAEQSPPFAEVSRCFLGLTSSLLAKETP